MQVSLFLKILNSYKKFCGGTGGGSSSDFSMLLLSVTLEKTLLCPMSGSCPIRGDNEGLAYFY